MLFFPHFPLDVFYLSVDEARLSNQASSPTRSETAAVNEGSKKKKKKLIVPHGLLAK